MGFANQQINKEWRSCIGFDCGIANVRHLIEERSHDYLLQHRDRLNECVVNSAHSRRRYEQTRATFETF